MKTFRAIKVAAWCLLLCLLVPVPAQSSDTDSGSDVVTRIIIRLTSEAQQAMSLTKTIAGVATGLPGLDSLHRRFEVREQRRLFDRPAQKAYRDKVLSTIYILELPDAVDIVSAAELYHALPEVVYAEPDYRVELFNAPDDPLFPHQWYLNNVGQEYLGMNRIDGDNNDSQVLKTGIPDADIDALEAFDSTHETTLPLVGIIDSGVDTDHEDLADNVWVNPGEDINGNGLVDPVELNGTDDDHNGFIDDFWGWDFSGDAYAATPSFPGDNYPVDNALLEGGHGTHCAGIVGAVSGNGIGIAGIVGPCRIMAIKVFPNALFTVCAEAIVYAADMDCDVINMSWGGPFYSYAIADAIEYAVGKGVLPIAAAGNSGGEHLLYPAALPQVFTVGASNSSDEVTYFSTYGDHVEVVAPGEDILSLRGENTDIYEHGGAYGKEPLVHIVEDKYYLMDGTSMAGPCVVGVAAHLLAASPGLPAARIIEIIEASADDIIYPYGDTTESYPGRDIYSGYGRVNLYAALQMLSGRLAKIDYPYHRAIVSGDIAVIGTAAGDNFTDYRLEYGTGYEPDTWTLIASSTTSVSKDTLGIWHSGDLSGLYTLRLTVGEENQAMVRVIADNVPTVEISSPGIGDTLTGMVSIYGSTVVSDFSAYILEFGYGETPAAWDTVVASTRMVADDLLGTFILNSLVSGSTGIFRLIVTTSTGGTYADSVSVYSASITAGGWSQNLTAYGAMSPSVGDITGDHNLDVVTGTGYLSLMMNSGGIYAFTCDGEPVPGWPKDTIRNIRCIPAVGDLDGDGIDDVVMPGRAYLSYAEDWPDGVFTSRSGNDSWPSTAVIADLENDGEPEVLVVNRVGTVFAWRWNGRPVIPEAVIPGSLGKFAETPGYGGIAFGYPGVTVADLDHDGEREVIVCSADAEIEEYGGVSIFDIDANVLLGPRDVPDTFSHISGFAIANFDESDDLEIIIAGAFPDCFCVTAMKKDGSHLPGYPIRLEDVRMGEWFGNFPAVGDIEGDGILELAITVWSLTEARVYAWHQDGTPLGQIEPDESTDGTRSIQPIFASVSGCMGSPILANITGDGRAEIIARAGHYFSSGYERIMAWDAEGTVVPGFPIFALGFTEIANSPGYIPVVSDLDHNGLADMILNSETVAARQTVVWNFEAPFLPDASPWPAGMHDSWNSKVLGFDPHEYVRGRHPQGLHVVANAPGVVTLGWIPKRSWISTGYNIYRSPVSGQPGDKVNAVLIPYTDSTFVDTSTEGGNVVYYTITNVDSSGMESPPSPELEVLTGRPSAPIGLQAQVIENDVRLTWYTNPAEENVEQYKVYLFSMTVEDFVILDSAAGEPVYIHRGPKPSGSLYYRQTAVNRCGESFPGDHILANIPTRVVKPYDLHEIERVDTSVTLGWTVEEISSGQGCNMYRTMSPGIYTTPPINDQYVPDPIDELITYTDTGLTPGKIYYYGVTQVVDGIESFLSNEVAFLAGQPHTPSLKVTSRRETITLHMSAFQEPIFEGFRIYRRESDGPHEALDSLVLDSICVDTAAAPGGDYRYKITAISTRGLESAYSNEEDGCLMTLDQGLALVDLTYGSDYGSSVVYGDSINAFYARALQGMTYTYVDHSSLQYDDQLRLYELSSHPVAILQAADARHSRLWNGTDTCLVLRKYLDAGGCLLIEGRRLVPGVKDGGFLYFGPGDFFHDYIGLDSAFTKPDLEFAHPFIGFIGADRIAPIEGYPQTVSVDTALVNSTYRSFDVMGAVPNVDYYMPLDNADILYTYIASDDTSSLNGKAVALRHVTDNYAVIWIGFPLYFIEEDIATQILHAGLDELSIITDASDDDDDDGNIPEVFALRQNVPNPFNPSTTIAYNLPRRSHVTISIYNILGQRVRTLVDDVKVAGYHRVEWDGTDMVGRKAATGIYLYRLVADNYAETKKMLLLK